MKQKNFFPKRSLWQEKQKKIYMLFMWELIIIGAIISSLIITGDSMWSALFLALLFINFKWRSEALFKDVENRWDDYIKTQRSHRDFAVERVSRLVKWLTEEEIVRLELLRTNLAYGSEKKCGLRDSVLILYLEEKEGLEKTIISMTEKIKKNEDALALLKATMYAKHYTSKFLAFLLPYHYWVGRNVAKTNSAA